MFTLASLIAFILGGVIAVTVPKFYAWVKSKIVSPVEAKVAALEVSAKTAAAPIVAIVKSDVKTAEAIVAEAEKKV